MLLAPRPPLVGQQKADFSELERVTLEELAATKTPGAAVAMVSGNKVVYAKGFGVADVETGASVEPEMLFRIGSTTKVFTAALLVTLAEEGKLKLDEPIGHYVRGLSPKLSQVTARQLSSHTAGMRDRSADYGVHDGSALATTVRSWADEERLLEPGRAFSYSNLGFTLAGFLAQEVGGKPYDILMNERLFKPLGMARSTFHPTVAMTYPFAQGHEISADGKPTVVRPFSDDAAYWPCGFMFSSVSELARFAIAFLNGGRIEGKQALAPSVIAEMSTPRADIPNIFEDGHYGYGLFIHRYRGLRVFEHGGSMPGFVCLFRMVPEQHFAVIILTNQSGGVLNKTAEKVMELMLPLAKKAQPSPKPALPMSEAEMANCVGTYSNRWSMEILLKGGQLYLKRGDEQLAITKISGSRFSVTRAGSSEPDEFELARGADGKAEYLQMALWAFKRTDKNRAETIGH